ncbi:MAG: alpha/beta hydrolase-fold protein [Planctomycetia bacterium]|nr:alpha/beta hydrolase-fold protein [Planctomycetia bacterium]
MSNIQEIQRNISPPSTRNKNVFRPSEFIRPSKTEHQGTFPHLIMSPIHYEPGYSYPLIVWLHGAGRDENQLFQVMPYISNQNYVAVAPRGLMRKESENEPTVPTLIKNDIFSLYNWQESPDAITEIENRIFDSIERVTEQYHIARHRIFIAGADVGGTMALRIGTRFPHSFAGAISLGGAFPSTEMPLRNWQSLRSFPMFLIVGSKSKIYSSFSIANHLRQFHTAGLSVSIHQYNAEEELTPKMFRDVNGWIMNQINSSK